MTANIQHLRMATRRFVGGNGVMLALLATLLWSTTGLFYEVLGRDYGVRPVGVSFWRSLMITVLLGGLVWRRGGWAGFRLNRIEGRFLGFNGIIGMGLFGVLWGASVQTNGTAVATTLLYISPIIVALGGWLFLQESIGWGRAVAIGVSVIGCALVAGAYDPTRLLANPTGALLGLGSGITFGFYTLCGKLFSRHTQRDGLSTLFYLFGFSLLLLGPWYFIEVGPAQFVPRLDGTGWLLLIFLSYGPSLGGYALYNLSLRYLPAALASLITTLEQPTASLLALWLLGHGLNAVQWIGGLLIVGSVVALQSSNLWNQRPKT